MSQIAERGRLHERVLDQESATLLGRAERARHTVKKETNAMKHPSTKGH
jgi:hypothetical protein